MAIPVGRIDVKDNASLPPALRIGLRGLRPDGFGGPLADVSHTKRKQVRADARLAGLAAAVVVGRENIIALFAIDAALVGEQLQLMAVHPRREGERHLRQLAAVGLHHLRLRTGDVHRIHAELAVVEIPRPEQRARPIGRLRRPGRRCDRHKHNAARKPAPENRSHPGLSFHGANFSSPQYCGSISASVGASIVMAVF